MTKVVPIGCKGFIENAISVAKSLGFIHIRMEDVRNNFIKTFLQIDDHQPNIMGHLLNNPLIWMNMIDNCYSGNVIVTSDRVTDFDNLKKGWQVIQSSCWEDTEAFKLDIWKSFEHRSGERAMFLEEVIADQERDEGENSIY